jgi:hypothetical protein
MTKPELLYHASHDTTIDEFEPRNNFPRFEGEGNLVFATQYVQLAAMFLSPLDIPTEISVYGDRYVIFINADEAEYIQKDKGGAIYSFSSVQFEVDPTIGMGESEWTSIEPVRPISKTIYATSIEAMDMYGIERYFVDTVTMERIQADPAHALDLVDSEMRQR